MRARILSLRKNIISIITQRHYGKPPRCDAHMNELPVPCGPWEPWYTAKQNLYNKFLVVGILWWLFSLGMVIYTDSLFFNWGPPLNPGPPSDMVEECDDSDS
ncbi:unnamed protein product [Arctia plantaginis]|uniref:Deltamethrin resistance protein prag01 domain-containing protein n=1 Tax=Arctia plantaginis TaxID=874455 RepID=A0A8S1A0V4_ARCPL|nr:unnamed protein product [Arctia plantaginis]